MATALFTLKNPIGKNETLIYLVFRYADKRIKVSTKEKIIPAFWDQKNQKVRKSKDFLEYPEFNKRLKNIKEEVFNEYRRIVNENIYFTPEILRKQFVGIIKKEPTNQRELIEFIGKLIDERKNTVKNNTLKKYRTTLKHLENFSEVKKKKIDFNLINLDFYYEFLDYLIKDLKFTDNTAGKYIKVLKTFLNEATERGINQKLDYKSKRFKSPSEEVEKIYLNESEILKIYYLDLSGDKRLERVRDLFVLECFIGQRFSDTTQLQPENIIQTPKGKIIKISTTEKTGVKVAIPLHWVVEEVFKKYGNQIPPPISNQKTNIYLKEVGKLAGMDDKVYLSKTKGGIRVTSTFKKYELITTHTARRSFATNLYLAGVPAITIMKFTGHKTERTFLGYIRVTAEEVAIKTIDHPFFKKKSQLKVV